MAQVDRSATTNADWLLDYLIEHWSAVPRIAEEWPKWEGIDQEVFQMEWVIKEDNLHVLEGLAEKGELTPGQRVRYESLRRLIAAHRPILDRLSEGQAA